MSVEEGPGADARAEARRHAALRHRRHAQRGPHHQPAQGRLGLDARQLLRHVPARAMPDVPVTLHRRVSRAARAAGCERQLRQRAGRATSRTSPTIDVSASIAQVQRVLDQVIRAVEFLFGFTLAAGLVVLFAAVTATREARAREFAVMRAHGRERHVCSAQVQRAELLGVGALAGLLASVAAMAVGWALARYVFEFSWNASPLGAAGRRAGRRAAGAGGRLVGPARGAAPAGGRDVAAGAGVINDRRRFHTSRSRCPIGCRCPSPPVSRP